MTKNLTLYNFKRKAVEKDNLKVQKIIKSTKMEFRRCKIVSNFNESCKLCNLELFLSQDWLVYLKDEFPKEYFQKIIALLHNEKVFFPPVEKIFYFSHFFPIQNTKVVIIGQDPYHNKGRATGLAFNVPSNVPMPPSLRNIFNEVRRNYKDAKCDLEHWAKQGVLLLNETLTVTEAKPNSHSTYGWSVFTNKILTFINNEYTNKIFMLWGAFAGKKRSLINEKKHFVLVSTHPSPFSADKGFNGCGHFQKANEYLKQKKLSEIEW